MSDATYHSDMVMAFMDDEVLPKARMLFNHLEAAVGAAGQRSSLEALVAEITCIADASGAQATKVQRQAVIHKLLQWCQACLWDSDSKDVPTIFR